MGSLVFDLDARRARRSRVFAESVSDFIFTSWVEAGYLTEAKLVRNRGFTGAADYEFVIDGRHRGTEAIGMQIVALVSLGLIPTFYDQHTHIQIQMTRRSDEMTFEASAQDGYRVVGWLPFLATFWRESEGREDTYRRIGDHLYASLREQGAFAPSPLRGEDAP